MTRDSVIPGDLAPPYTARRIAAYNGKLAHTFALFEGASMWVSCCGMRTNIKDVEAETSNCLECALCRGCPACNPNHVRESTMHLGKWETKDGRRLYPFEMDPIHLMNAIAKLKRDKHHFKDAWETWVEILEEEAQLRGLL